MVQDYEIALNFWPLLSDDFSFEVYRRVQEDENRPKPKDTSLHQLPLSREEAQTEEPEYIPYWIRFDHEEGYSRFECRPYDNVNLTRQYLLHSLIEKSSSMLNEEEFSVEGNVRERVEYILSTYQKGEQRVWLRPFLLRRTYDFGYLVDFRFALAEGKEFDREVQHLSLSLDEDYRENYDYYVDRYRKIQRFAKFYFHQLFPIATNTGDTIKVSRKLKQVDAPQLDKKTYVFGNKQISNSQFMGIKNNGPLELAPDDVLLFFVYKSEHKPYSYDLFKAIRGDTYATFPGMEKMFGYTLGEEHVRGVPIDNFDEEGVERVVRQIMKEANDRPVVPIVLIPWDKDDVDEQNRYRYYLMKHRFLKNGLPSQFVSLSTLKDDQTLKWAVSNIAVATFSKMGGVPWKVSPRHSDCLIVGIGQSHKKVDDEIVRYFAYSVLTDSSGIYKDLRVLGKSRDESQYLEAFKQRLLSILHEYEGPFKAFVLHSTFTMRREEMEAMKEVLEEYGASKEGEKNLVALKFNHVNDYFGFDPDSNSMVPYESTHVNLSYADDLVWFEGLQYNKSNVNSRIGRPTHIKFLYPKPSTLSKEEKRSYLQDALNLSGANWRGFNAKSRPVSVFYASRIAEFFRAFDEYEFEEVDLSNMTPWFL